MKFVVQNLLSEFKDNLNFVKEQIIRKFFLFFIFYAFP